MAHGTEDRDPHWGEKTAHVTFIWTLVGAALFAGAVIAFIL